MAIVDSTIFGNDADDGGGGGIENRGTLTIVNSTIAVNAAYADSPTATAAAWPTLVLSRPSM